MRYRHAVAAAGLSAAAAYTWRWLVRWRPAFRVTVEGPSMMPVLAPGDGLVAVRLPLLEPGDIVVIVDPDDEARILVKRVAGLGSKTIEVAGDNSAVSRDSRSFGEIPRSSVLGRVVYRYRPSSAVTRFRRRDASSTSAGCGLEQVR
ncbi:MAG: S26 family signal peptidase [Acidimicrobiales bacterium]